ncbi:flagellin [Noviherbaspirillum sp. CPCC 100848]|uniref:Flagellin n=1 Tax=Noviherbaspirillum album TaxID=3080276 RepID=A0ABU6JK08_9BURK|nr:flagellin [Noviherbaspirillum sp. CPCC 100848]MEC4723831.1 flagellin [Noviherbaspirillum sp. CPCC 100848]
MSSVINTNIASLNAQRNLSSSSSGLTTALQRLSSGMRINSAKDDAAGLAISQRMASQIGGLNQAARNANDAISLAQTAEGALSGIGDNLQRLRTLAVQAANSTNSDSDRATIQTEVSSLVAEIGRVANTTEFNGIKLLDGSFTSQAFQVGANANQTISVSVGGASTDKLGATQASSLTASNNGNALVAGDMTINGVAIGGSTSSSDNASSTGNSGSAIAKAAAINAVSAQTGVTAKADVNELGGASMTASTATGTLTVNGVATASITTTNDGATSRAAVIAAINAISGQTGVVATDGGTSAAGIKLSAADGRNITVSATGLTSAQTGVDNLGSTTYGKYTLTSSKEITVTGNATNLKNAGVNAGTYSAQTAYASSTAGTATAFVAGDFKINGIAIGASVSSDDTSSSSLGVAGASAISKAAAINKLTSQTGVAATVNTTTLAGAGMTASTATGTLTINGIATASISTNADGAASRAAVITAINAISGQTGVKAIDGGTSAAGISLVAADGRNITVSATGLTSAQTGIDNLGGTTYGTFTLSSAKTFTVEAGTTGTASTTTGMVKHGTYGSGRSGQALSTIDVSTASGANNAITAIDNAISSVNRSRAELGAIQNRFTSTISTLQSTSENLSAAKSRIVDTDFAAETANMTRGQILQQAGTAMLAQANGLPNGVLALLR